MDERDRIILENNMKKAEEYVRLRDEFAKAALTGILAAIKPGERVSYDDVAMWAYNHADAMIEERNREV